MESKSTAFPTFAMVGAMPEGAVLATAPRKGLEPLRRRPRDLRFQHCL